MRRTDVLMQEVLARLRAQAATIILPMADGGTISPQPAQIRRSSRIPVTRKNAPAIHLIDGPDRRQQTKPGTCATRTFEWTLSVFVRDENDYGQAGIFVPRVLAIVSPNPPTPYEAIGTLTFNDVVPTSDADDVGASDVNALRVDILFYFLYSTDAWSLQ